MRKLVSAATSLVMAATMVSAVAPVVAGAADAKKGFSVLTYKEATLPSGVTVEGTTVNVSADAVKAGDVKIPLAVYVESETSDVKGLSAGITVNSKNADVKNIKFAGYAPGDVYFDSDVSYTMKDGTTFTTNKVVSFAGAYNKRQGYSPNGRYTAFAREKMESYGVENAYLGLSWISSGSKYEWFGEKSTDYPFAVFDVTLPKGIAEGDYVIDYYNGLSENGNPVCMVETIGRYDAIDSKNLDLNTLTIKVGDSVTPPDSSTTTTQSTTTSGGGSSTTTTTTSTGTVTPVTGDFVFDFDNPDSADGYWHANAGESVDVDMHVTAAQDKKVSSFSFEVEIAGGITVSDILDSTPAFNSSVLRDISHGTCAGTCEGSDGHGIIVTNGTAIMYTFDVPAGTPDGLYEINLTKAQLSGESNDVFYDSIGIKKGYIQVGEGGTTTTTQSSTTTTTTTKGGSSSTTTTSATTTTSGVGSSTTSTSKVPGTPDYGDTNCDGKVRINDVVILNRYLNDAKSISISDQGKLNADCYNPKNGQELTAEDSKAIIQSIVELVTLPVNK